MPGSAGTENFCGFSEMFSTRPGGVRLRSSAGYLDVSDEERRERSVGECGRFRPVPTKVCSRRAFVRMDGEESRNRSGAALSRCEARNRRPKEAGWRHG